LLMLTSLDVICHTASVTMLMAVALAALSFLISSLHFFYPSPILSAVVFSPTHSLSTTHSSSPSHPRPQPTALVTNIGRQWDDSQGETRCSPPIGRHVVLHPRRARGRRWCTDPGKGCRPKTIRIGERQCVVCTPAKGCETPTIRAHPGSDGGAAAAEAGGTAATTRAGPCHPAGAHPRGSRGSRRQRRV
jgi:hypothetical protein